MGCSWAYAVFAAAGSLILCANGGVIQRQGATPARGVGTVFITTRGAVSVHGETTDRISWTATMRVQAGEERRARDSLAAGYVKERREGQDLSLSFSGIEGEPGAGVTIVVPRDLRPCRVRAKGGSIRAQDLSSAVDVSSDAGSLQADRIRGPVTARTGGGEFVSAAWMAMRTVTGAGGIRVDWIGGLGQLETAGGEILCNMSTGRCWHRAPAATSRSCARIFEIVRADFSIAARTSGG